MTASELTLSAADVAAIFGAMSHPTRVAVVEQIAQADELLGPLALTSKLGVSLPLVSYHVRLLDTAGLIELAYIEPRRGAVAHFYELTDLGRRAATLVELIR